MITITCAYPGCGEVTSGEFRSKSRRLYYDCPVCKRSNLLKQISLKNGATVMVSLTTGRKNRNMVRVTMYIRGDIMDALRAIPGEYSETVNLALAKYLEM